MRHPHTLLFFVLLIVFTGCKTETTIKEAEPLLTQAPFLWESANVYFLLTDRFNNGDKSNDINFERSEETALLRNFLGGDIRGIIAKINEGYFTDLGVNAIWFTPVVEQIHGYVDEGTGLTYGYHGYWTKDWTALDPNFGTYADLVELVQTAHDKGIRIIMDVVLNHTGPVTDKDVFWGEPWARQSPSCTYTNYETTVPCTLVENLPDIKTAKTQEVALPDHLVRKWKEEGRFEQEFKELDNFFTTTGLKKIPRNYIIKWLTDYVRELGIDAYRVDTVKHVEEEAWSVLKKQAALAFDQWKEKNPKKVLDTASFYMLGEVYNYSIDNGLQYNFGDKQVDYFNSGFDNLINFQFKYDAQSDYESIFFKYDSILHTSLKGQNILNYATSHDDGSPFDKERIRPLETGTKLLLTPGLSQIYYGDEIARDLSISEANGDATLRSSMNWETLKDPKIKNTLQHWQKLGQFRKNHPAIGAGKHQRISQNPYVFKRTFKKNDFKDQVVVGLDLPVGEKKIETATVFEDGSIVRDAYSGIETTVNDGFIIVNTPANLVLLEQVKY